MEEVGADSDGDDEEDVPSNNNRLRKRTPKSAAQARTRRESDEESGGGGDEEEAEWEQLQRSVQKHKKKFDSTNSESHPVHAPFFPEVRVSKQRVILVVVLPEMLCVSSCALCRRSRSAGGCT